MVSISYKYKPVAPYNGYLKPHEDQIRRLASEGVAPVDIARVLFAQGVRSAWPDIMGEEGQIYSFSGLIRHMLGINKKIFDVAKIKKRISRAKLELKNAERLLALVKREEKRLKRT